MDTLLGKTTHFLRFAREFVTHPRSTGAICPSSPYLAQRMAALVPAGPGKVIELGPGMGAVTEALLQRGVKPEDLILVERSTRLASQLKRRFPGVRVIQGDAAHLSDLLGPSARDARAIVSSLPLRSLPAQTVQAILGQLGRIANPGTVFIQFTYHLRSSCRTLPTAFEAFHGSLVWRNLPPARVDAFRWRGG